MRGILVAAWMYPVEIKGLGEKDVEALMARVRGVMVAAKPACDAESARLLAAWTGQKE